MNSPDVGVRKPYPFRIFLGLDTLQIILLYIPRDVDYEMRQTILGYIP
jgi:hypothetical protein